MAVAIPEITMTSSTFSPESTQMAIRRDRRTAGLRFGLVAGLSFALGAWGLDMLGLIQADGMFPWLKLALGILVALPVGALAGWLAVRLDKTWASVLIWMAAGAVLGWVASRLPFDGPYPFLLKWLEPSLQGRIQYTFYPAFTFRMGVVLFTSVGLSAFAGLIELNIVDSAAFAAAPLSRWLPLLMVIPLLAAPGVTADSTMTAPTRTPLLAVDGLIRDAIAASQNPSATPAAGSHAIVLDPLLPWLNRPHQLILASYDDAFTDVEVLVNFDGYWGQCRIFYDAPVGCEKLSP